MKVARRSKNPWLIPFIVLVIVMAASMLAILQSASQSSQDIRSRAFDDVREVPNGQIPRPTGAITVTPNPNATATPKPGPIGGTVITGVSGSTRGPLLNQTPRPTSSISPTPRLTPCSPARIFLGIPCATQTPTPVATP